MQRSKENVYFHYLFSLYCLIYNFFWVILDLLFLFVLYLQANYKSSFETSFFLSSKKAMEWTLFKP